MRSNKASSDVAHQSVQIFARVESEIFFHHRAKVELGWRPDPKKIYGSKFLTAGGRLSENSLHRAGAK